MDASRILVTGDIAFLWRGIAPELFKRNTARPAGQVIGLSFRQWPLGDKRALQGTIAKAQRFCRYLLEDESRRILFLSTCQGIPGYVDDSRVALEIKQQLPADLRSRCEVDRSRYRPEELIRALGQCDAYIGMRLHACVLAMLAGVPAMGLGYEDKTWQIFRQMGFESYQTRFDSDVESWVGHAEKFFAHTDEVVERLPSALDERYEAASKNIEIVERELTRVSQGPISPEVRWSQAAGRYDLPHLRLRQVAALVNQLRPGRMLDVGCSSGRLRTLCPGAEYVGCDFIAADAKIGFPFYQCNLNREPLPAELDNFDVIVCSGISSISRMFPPFCRLSAPGCAPGGAWC